MAIRPMVDLQPEMAELWTSLGAPGPERVRAIQVLAARSGEGSSTVARELALYAARAPGSRSVWLVDLDLGASPQYDAIAADQPRYGPLGPAAAASPDGSIFFAISPASRSADGRAWPAARYLVAHRVGQARLWVTRLQREELRPRQTIHILSTADYWDALRSYADVIIVDTPAADRSQAGLAVAPFMDETILVVGADTADTRAPARLRDAVATAGGAVSGLFVNRVSLETPRFLQP